MPTKRKPGYKLFSFGGGSTIYLYGGIEIEDSHGYYVDSSEFIAEVEGIEASEITVRIGSVGGDPVAAGAMYQALVDHPAKVITIADTKAYSAGSMVLQAGDERRARPLAMIMVHGPGWNRGNTAKEHRETADALDAHAEMMVTAYTKHGIDEGQIRSWLSDGKDHYFSAKEALQNKLIDKIEEKSEIGASMPLEYRVAAMLDDGEPHAATSAKPEKEETAMAEETQAVTAAATDNTDQIVAKHSKTVKAATQAGVKAEATRRKAIAAVFEDFYDADPLNPVTALHNECMDDTQCDELSARRKLMAYLAGQSADPVVAPQAYAMETQPAAPPRASRHLGGAMQVGRDQVDKRAEGLTAALRIKAGLETDRKVIDQERRGEFLAMSLTDIMAMELRASGYAVAGSREDIARKYLQVSPVLAAGPSHGTDHLPAILGNIANLSAMSGWEASEETWDQWTIPGTLNNYQTHTRANLALLDKLDLMLENQEWEYGNLADVKQRITGYFHGKRYGLSIQAIVNDDLGELSRAFNAWGEAGKATVGDYIYALLTTSGSGGLGQTMDEDSKVLFHADHSNYVASGSGGIPSEATLNTARAAMVSQTDPNSRKVAARPRFILHGPALFSTIRKVLNSEQLTQVDVDGATGATIMTGSSNAVQAMNLMPVEEYRFTSNQWVLAAARNTVEVAGVGGPVSPRVDQSPISNTPGLTYELSMPFGASVLSFRGLYYNHGA